MGNKYLGVPDSIRVTISEPEWTARKDGSFVTRGQDGPHQWWDGPIRQDNLEWDIPFVVWPARSGSYGSNWSHGPSEMHNVRLVDVGNAEWVGVQPVDPTRPWHACCVAGSGRTGRCGYVFQGESI